MAHFTGTGPEIWRQSRGVVDAFVCAAGTGGTIGGVSRFLKVMFPISGMEAIGVKLNPSSPPQMGE